MKNTNSTLNGEDLKNITSRVIYLRNQILHMTQSEFASVLKMSQTYLSLIESGKRKKHIRILMMFREDKNS